MRSRQFKAGMATALLLIVFLVWTFSGFDTRWGGRLLGGVIIFGLIFGFDYLKRNNYL